MFMNPKHPDLKEILSVNFKNLLDRFNEKQLCDLAFNLTFLDHFSQPVVEKLFNLEFQVPENIRWKYLKIWSKIDLSIPNRYEFPLLPTLVQALGGSNNYVKTNLLTKLHHYIGKFLPLL